MFAVELISKDRSVRPVPETYSATWCSVPSHTFSTTPFTLPFTKTRVEATSAPYLGSKVVN